MLKKYLSILLIFIPAHSSGQNIHFQAIGVENGISQPNVTSIYQDEFGIIWVGTKDDGLFRMDRNGAEVCQGEAYRAGIGEKHHRSP